MNILLILLILIIFVLVYFKLSLKKARKAIQDAVISAIEQDLVEAKKISGKQTGYKSYSNAFFTKVFKIQENLENKGLRNPVVDVLDDEYGQKYILVTASVCHFFKINASSKEPFAEKSLAKKATADSHA